MLARTRRATLGDSAMRSLLIAGLVALAPLPAFAGGFGLKPGLWETRIIKQVVDGRDLSAQIAGAQSQMLQVMANMPPEQRARMDSIMRQRGGPAFTSDGTIRMCISPELASRDKPIVDKDGRCQPAMVNRNGSQTTFEFACNANGITTTAKGESAASGDLIKTRVDMTTRQSGGETHVMHNETEMKFLSSDCGDVKPMAVPKASP